MITEAIIGVLTTIIGTILDALPTLTLPDWLTAVPDQVATAVEGAGALGYWLPIATGGTLLGYLPAVFATCMGIWVVRKLLNTFTGGGAGN